MLTGTKVAKSPSSGDPSATVSESTTTSAQWIIIDGTSIFWPTSTDYFYGPTEGPKAAAVSCNAEWIQYNVRSRSLWGLGATSSTMTTTSYGFSDGACWSKVRPEIFNDPHTGPLTTLCDGIPRALGPRETVTAWYPGTGPCITTWDTFTGLSSIYRQPESSAPSCSLNTPECAPIWSTYSSLDSEYSSAHRTPTEGDTASPIRPSKCPRETIYTADPCAACHWNADPATVYYWPVTTADGDLCKQNGTTIPPSGPSTVVLDGKTLKSPSIYISFDTISAWGNQRRGAEQCGDTHTSTMVEVKPEDISSVRSHRNGRYHHEGTAYPLNFADYQPHAVGNYTMSLIPWDAYKAGFHCPINGHQLCTMIRDDYYPWIQLPEEVREIDPKWTACDRMWNLPLATMVALGDQNLETTHTQSTQDTQSQPATPHSPVVPPTPTATGGTE